MLRLGSNHGTRSCDGVTRRDFLRVGGLAVGLSLTDLALLQQLGAAPRSSEKACIQLFLVGGPSQLDTWDLKPGAPEQIRGPFRPIQTNVPGMHISEHFPRMAGLADRYAILRSVYHREAPIHEMGQQLLQTGRLARDGIEWPHCGAVASKLRPGCGALPSWVVLPGIMGNTGVSIGHGQTSGFLGEQHQPFTVNVGNRARDLEISMRGVPQSIDPARMDGTTNLVSSLDTAQCALESKGGRWLASAPEEEAFAAITSPQAKRALDLGAETDAARDRYGWNTFGQSCLLARRLVQHGVRLVTVNMFDTVFNQITWDCHANGGDLNTTLDDYRETLCPMYDRAYTALLEDLEAWGLLDNTLVLSMGEFGRTPQLNGRGGRDHWPGVWSILMAGGGVRGGQIIGSSDKHGEEPRDRPIHASEIAATVYHALGIDPRFEVMTDDGQSLPLVDARPILELF
jgi:uncharacterized protein (DUF1501 family)